jgi:hypothetical protein
MKWIRIVINIRGEWRRTGANAGEIETVDDICVL